MRTMFLVVAVLAVSGCPQVGDEGLNEFCEQDANCATGLTCTPNISGYCLLGNCNQTGTASACCDVAHHCAGECCTTGACVQKQIPGGTIEVCPNAPEPVSSQPN